MSNVGEMFSQRNGEVLMGLITRVVMAPACKPSEGAILHIFFETDENSKEMVIPVRNLLSSQLPFQTLFASLFKKCVPLDKNEWATLVEYILSTAEDGELDETEEVIAADMLFEELCNTFDITQDKNALKDRSECRFFVEHTPHGKTYYVVPSASIAEVMSDLNLKVSRADLSPAATKRGYKLEKTRDVKVPGSKKPIKCWWFLPEALQAQGLELGGQP